MHDDRTKLVAAVSRGRSLMASAAVLIAGLGERLRNAIDADDTAALNALADELNGDTSALEAAIAANTPAAEIAHDAADGDITEPTPEPAADDAVDAGATDGDAAMGEGDEGDDDEDPDAA